MSSHLKDGDGGPEDVVEVFPVALTLRIGQILATTVPDDALLVFVCTKLTAKQVHAQDAALNKREHGSRALEC